MAGSTDVGIGGYLATNSGGNHGKPPKPFKPAQPSKPASPKPVSPKPSPSASPTPPINEDSCAFGLGGQQGPTNAPALVDLAQRVHPTASPPSDARVIYVDLRDAAKAFETTDSLRQQIIDRRVGPSQVENLERAEVIAQLASAFNGDFNPWVLQPKSVKMVLPTPTPNGQQLVQHGAGNPTYSNASNSMIQEAYTAYGSCVTKFDFLGCYNAVSEPEQQLVGTMATKNACAFASDYWLPSVTAIGIVYGSEMSRSFHNSESPTPSPVPTSDISKKSFSSPPGC